MARKPRDTRDLRTRILDADDTLRVAEILQELDADVPVEIGAQFLALTVRWGDERFWGEAPKLGAESHITLGSKRGHHIAMHPDLAGWDDDDASEILRIEVEGTLLHELGHCLLDAAIESDAEVMRVVEAAAKAEPGVSTYAGAGERKRDRLHEQFAEAFRWWHADPDGFADRFPSWDDAVAEVLSAAD